MDLKQLGYFLALAEELHFARAARRLFIAQPPLSRQIQRLEAELGTPLFVRTKRSVRLTAAGEYLKAEAGRLFTQLDMVKEKLRLLADGQLGQVRIGYVGAVMHSLLPAALRELRQRYPEVNTVLAELTNQDQLEGLRRGRLDLGFVRSPLTAGDLAVVPIVKEAFALVISAAHPLAGRERVDLKELAAEPFICFARECAPAMVDTIFAIFHNAGLTPLKAHETSQINTILRLVESNLGYSLVPASVRTGYNLGLKFFELAEVAERSELSLIYNPAMVSPVTERVIRLFTNFFAREA